MLSLTAEKTQALIQSEHNYILKYAYKFTVKNMEGNTTEW